MGAWASAAAAREDLRVFVNDGPQDRPFKGKMLLGVVDGTNREFLTFEDRLVPGSLVPSIDYAELPAGQWSEVDPVIGHIQLAAAPTAGQSVRARYYCRYFLDGDLDAALQLAGGQMDESADVTLISQGLRAATLSYAASFAFRKQSIRWAERMSDRLLLNDAPVDGQSNGRSNEFANLARDYLRDGLALRTSFYQSNGRRNIPAFAMLKPRIASIGPRR